MAKNLNLSESVEIDVDFLGHKALNNCKEEITNRFGDKVLIDNKIDRRILSSVVFSDSSALRDLEGIVHPEMVSMVEKCFADTAGVVVIHAALLYRMKLDLLCDLIVWVEAPFIIFTSHISLLKGVISKSSIFGPSLFLSQLSVPDSPLYDLCVPALGTLSVPVIWPI